MNFFRTLFIRECRIAYHQGSDVILALSFWGMFIAFFPLSSSLLLGNLHYFAAGILWLGLLLMQLLFLSRYFREDYQEGILAEQLQSPKDFFEMLLSRLFILWLLYSFPIFLLAPLFGIMLHLNAAGLLMLELTFLLGTPSLVMLSAFVASLTMTTKNSTLLVSMLFLPLTVPLLIFSTSAVNASLAGGSTLGPLAWLGVIFLVSLLVLPVSTCVVLKASLD